MLSEAKHLHFISLKTNKCRFLASLGMTGPGDYFTPSQPFRKSGRQSRAESRREMLLQPDYPMTAVCLWGCSLVRSFLGA
jgi:hypothetical protein